MSTCIILTQLCKSPGVIAAMVGLSSLMIRGIFACVVVVAVHRDDMLDSEELALFCKSIKFTTAESDPITVNGLSFHLVIIPGPTHDRATYLECTVPPIVFL